MKKLFLVALLIFTVSTVSAQDYELVYANSDQEVQQKLDENKINGIEILSGVFADHRIGLAGLSKAKAEELKETLSNNPEVISTKMNEDFSDLWIESEATLSQKDLNDIITNSGATITGYSIKYFTNL